MKRQKTTQGEGEAKEKAYTVKGTHLQSKHSRCVGTGRSESPQPTNIYRGCQKKKRKGSKVTKNTKTATPTEGKEQARGRTEEGEGSNSPKEAEVTKGRRSTGREKKTHTQNE